jgi:2-phosphoglycerate kinase
VIRNLADALSHIWWIGGSPCSGKSSVAEALAAEFELSIYRCDDAYEQHRHLVDPVHFPIFHRLASASCDELWMRPVDTQVREEIDLYREEFRLIVDDLTALPAGRAVIAEGAALLPHLVHGLGIPWNRSIWLVPSPEFQREHYARREWRHQALAGCSNPGQAWANWMDRDIGFARFVTRDAAETGRVCITVDRSRPLDAILAAVRSHLVDDRYTVLEDAIS